MLRTSYLAFDVTMMDDDGDDIRDANHSPAIKYSIRLQPFAFTVLYFYLFFIGESGFLLMEKGKQIQLKKIKSIIRLKLDASPFGINFWSLRATPTVCTLGVCDPKSFFLNETKYVSYVGLT